MERVAYISPTVLPHTFESVLGLLARHQYNDKVQVLLTKYGYTSQTLPNIDIFLTSKEMYEFVFTVLVECRLSTEQESFLLAIHNIFKEAAVTGIVPPIITLAVIKQLPNTNRVSYAPNNNYLWYGQAASIKDALLHALEANHYTLVRPDLSNMKLDRLVLEQHTIIIREGCFVNADLSRGAFKNITFADCDMQRANLRGATFQDCVFSHCNLTKAVCSGAQFTNCGIDLLTAKQAQFDNTTLVNCACDYAQLDGSVFTKAIIENCYWNFVDATNGQFLSATIKHTECKSAKFNAAQMGSVLISGCNLYKAEFVNTDCVQATFQDVVAEESKFYTTRLNNAALFNCYFKHGVFSRSSCKDTLFHNCVFDYGQIYNWNIFVGSTQFQKCSFNSVQMDLVTKSRLAAFNLA